MLDTFVGNNLAKETLVTAVKSGRFPHAFIIEGEEGSGRKTFAKMLAAAAVCEDSDAPCGVCRACKLVSTDGHCDVLTYSPDGATFKVDAVRKIRDNAFVYPVEAKRKVNILLDCDKMNESAQNALLKVLEEPPAFMVFILVCQSASALLPTVRSRCVTITLQNPERNDAVNFIITKTGKPEAEILSALETAHGNIGKALNVMDGAENKSHEKAVAFLDSIKKRDRLNALKVLFTIEKDRPTFQYFFRELEILLTEEIKQTALGKESEITASKLTTVLDLVKRYEKQNREHIGQPLQISLQATTLTAEIFVQL